MFNDLFKSSEEKALEEAGKHFDQGMKHLEGKFFNRAMIEFKKAMELAHEEVYPRLMQELSNFSTSGQLDAALSIGLNLLKETPEDFELANKLGNFARELGNYNQAQSLYKMSIKINKHYEKAFYNLAACAVKVDIYDDQVKSAIAGFEKLDGYVYPDYAGEDTNPPETLAKALNDHVVADKEKKITELTQKIEKLEESGEQVEASQLKMDLDHAKAEPAVVGPKQVIEEFMRLIEEDTENANQHRYNLGIYALMNNLPNAAKDAFESLTTEEFHLLGLLNAIATDLSGHLNDAIDQVTKALGANEYNRYSNVNLGLMFKKAGKHFLATKYLIKTAALLEKSGGLYSMRELVRIAFESAEEENYKKAVNYLEIAVTENPDEAIWNKLGEVYINLKKYDEATEAFRAVLKFEPASPFANKKIQEIHDYYSEKGDALVTERKFKAAGEYYNKALGILKQPATLKSAASVFKELGDMDRADQLILELRDIEQAEKDKANEVTRLQKISEAKELMGKKNYRGAIETLESALRMKVDKNVYLQLSALYKGLKRKDDLEDLSNRWEKMLEHQEKMRLYALDQKRALAED